jgi:hypothetical protein
MTAPYGMSKAHVEDTGRKMRDGLVWSVAREKSSLRVYRPGEAVPMAGVVGMVEPARTAHTSRHNVRYSGTSNSRRPESPRPKGPIPKPYGHALPKAAFLSPLRRFGERVIDGLTLDTGAPQWPPRHAKG